MMKLQLLSAADQVAEHLKKCVAAGMWHRELPGGMALAKEFGVNHKTMEAALRLLEKEGVLLNHGARKARTIHFSAEHLTPPKLRIGILAGEPEDSQLGFLVQIRQQWSDHGHDSFFARRSLAELGLDAGKAAALIKSSPADAWLVVAGSRALMEWFAEGTKPFFGLFGLLRRLDYPGAGPDKVPAYIEAVRTLVGLGHRRIVLLAREPRHLPIPGYVERHFLAALQEAGIETSDYHFPLWKDSPEGLHHCLNSMFRVTPPTALLVQQSKVFAAVQQFLAGRGIRVPQDVSLICADPDLNFAWQVPSVAHIGWDSAPWVRRAVRWADHIARGKNDRRRTFSKAEFVPGGTVGRVGGK